MASTEQRTGFRLPWTPDVRPGMPADGQTPPDDDPAPDPAAETTPVPSDAEAKEMQETALQEAPTSDRLEPDATGDSNDAPAEDTAEVTAQASTDDVAEATPEPAASASSAKPRRDNALVTGLVKAMRDAAGTARAESAVRFAEEAKARVEAIHALSAEESAELRKQADAEIVEIRDWSKAEMARIKEETDHRIAERRRRLESQVDEHAASVEGRIERLNAASADFERRLDSFFEELLAEDDPARLAGLAQQLPEPPSLENDDYVPTYTAPIEVEVTAPAELETTATAEVDAAEPAELAFPMEVLDARGAAAAEAEAFVGLDADAAEDDGATIEQEIEPDPVVEADVARRLEAFALAAPVVEGVTSQLAVVGLVSVASIAGFKRGLAKTHGVRSVTVASGPSGDFIFTVIHDPEVDLQSAVHALEGFKAAVTGDAEGVLTITATDPESAS